VVKWVRRGSVAVVASALLSTCAGVADAVPSPQVKIVDGYRLTLSLENVAFQTVPNMAASPFVREGFITATSKLNVACALESNLDIPLADSKCNAIPLKLAKISMSAQVGCPLDVSGGTTTGLTPQFGSSLPLQGILQSVLPPPTPPPTPTDITDLAIEPNAQINPSVGLQPFPGYIRDVGLGAVPPTDTAEEKQAASGIAASLRGKDSMVISVQNAHMEVDQTENMLGLCGGTVTVRIYVQAEIETADSVDTVDMYGDIYTL